jgi:aminoglycoside phosphotransferase (APT) family kinase protein
VAALIGAGRSADVYEHEPGWVLRRYREPQDTEREVAAMELARSHGFPVAEAKALSDTDIVMQRLEGPTMLEELERRPWLIDNHASLLATLHRQLHAIEAPVWLPAPVGEGDRLLHLDLHPDNVIITTGGPSVIDWPNAARGPGCGDVAYTWIIVATAVAPRQGLRTRIAAAAGRHLFMRLFLRRFNRAEQAEIRRRIPVGAAVRLEDRNLPPDEREKVRRIT